MNFKSLLVSKALIVRNVIVFLIFYLSFFLYQSLAKYDNLRFLLLINISVLVIFLITLYSSKLGLYLFIFFIPLLNSLTTILEIQPVQIILFFFFAFFMGFILNLFNNDFQSRSELYGPIKVFESEISRAFLIFIIILSLSAAITIFRYSNFFPFITNNYHNLKVNINGFGSNGAILWTLSFFFNYFIGFALFFAVFNILKNIRDVINVLVILIFSTFLTSAFAIYQHFINPYIGNFKFWVETGRLNATFSDPNALGGYCILIFPIFISLIIVARRWYSRLIFCILFVFFILTVIFSGSRSALLGIILTIIIFLIMGLKRLIRFIKKLPKKRKITVIITVIVIISIILIAIAGITLTKSKIKSDVLKIGLIQRSLETIKTFLSYFKTAGPLEALKSISNYRYIYWNQAINMTKNYPLAGVGAGSYIIELPDYLWNFEHSFTIVDYAGNYYLQVLSEFGLVGLIMTLFIFYFIIKKYVLYFRYRKNSKMENSNKISSNSSSNWLLIGLFISFISMIFAQFFGPHTNFIEVQFTFWLIIGLMVTFIKIKQVNYTQNLKSELKNNIYNNSSIVQNNDDLNSNLKRGKVPLMLSNRIYFNIGQRISLVIILLIFAGSFLINSFTDLSITATQNRDNWDNNYGFYNVENRKVKEVRWTTDDASEVLEKKGSVIIIPLRDAYPVEDAEPNVVKFYIDNLLVKKIKLEDDSWYNLKLDIPKFAGNHPSNRFTLTIVSSRSWVPKELGLNMDTRVLGVMVGEITFID